MLTDADNCMLRPFWHCCALIARPVRPCHDQLFYQPPCTTVDGSVTLGFYRIIRGKRGIQILCPLLPCKRLRNPHHAYGEAMLRPDRIAASFYRLGPQM